MGIYMSDLNDFLNSISSMSSETIDLPKWIRIKQIGSSNSEVNDSDTSEAQTAMENIQPSETSDDNDNNKTNDTSDNNMTAIQKIDDSSTSESEDGKKQDGKKQDGGNISKLLQMLSSDSETEMNLSTATEQLEDQLKALLQAGGAKKASKKSKKASKKSKKASKKSKKASK